MSLDNDRNDFKVYLRYVYVYRRIYIYICIYVCYAMDLYGVGG